MLNNKLIRAMILSLFLFLTTLSLCFPVQHAYATATVLPPPIARFFTAAGAPCAGCQIFTYAAGTTTPLASYSDSTALVANTNPVILDANGQAPIWISGAYKIVLEDANNVVQWTEDNIQDLFTTDNIQATSTTSMAVQNGSPLTLTTQAGKYFAAGVYIQIVDNAAPTTNWMHCPITSYIGTQLVCTPDESGGSGTKTAWTISLSGPAGPTGAAGPGGASSGDMLGASNLAVGAGGVASAAMSRTNLGLGSSAIVNAGTGASQMVQLTAAAKLPAVDGSLLTNVAGVPVVTNSAQGKFVIGSTTIEWGSGTSGVAVTFPTAFSNTPYSVQVTPTAASSCSTCTTTSATLQTSSGFTPRAQSSAITWIAIGPT